MPKAPRSRPVLPNAGIAAAYRRKIERLVEDMARSIEWFVRASYRQNPPEMATDETPAKALQREMDKLAKRWGRRFDDAAPELARWFAQQARNRSDRALREILKRAGWTVDFRMTRAMRDVLAATVEANVQLIKTIPQQYLADVQGMVMRSVQTGRDLGPLAKEMRQRYGLTKKRAALIARDQNNKCTSALQKVRQTELGIEQGVWLHSHAGKEPRPTHLANHGKKFNIAEGWFDPDPRVRRRIMPGELINCFPGATKVDLAANVEKAFRHRYRGQLTEVISDSGKTLRGTPNHPVLTPQGWRPLGSLDEGDHVIEVADESIRSIVSKRDVDHAVPLIGQIFDTLAETGRSRSEISLSSQFHGDGFAHGYVDVVDAARALSIGIDAARLQSRGEFTLPVTDDPAACGGSLVHLLKRRLLAATRDMRGFGETAAAIFAFLLHSQPVRLAGISEDAAGIEDSILDRRARNAVFFGERQHALSGLVLPTNPTRIRQVRTQFFDGHVFNLQTTAGWYIAEGIIVHNCRCTWKPIVPGLS